MLTSNVLCQLTLTDAERNELLAGYENQRKSGHYPPMAIQILAHNVRQNRDVDVYISHAAELIDFASQQSLQWLETRIVEAYRRFRK